MHSRGDTDDTEHKLHVCKVWSVLCRTEAEGGVGARREARVGAWRGRGGGFHQGRGLIRCRPRLTLCRGRETSEGALAIVFGAAGGSEGLGPGFSRWPESPTLSPLHGRCGPGEPGQGHWSPGAAGQGDWTPRTGQCQLPGVADAEPPRPWRPPWLAFRPGCWLGCAWLPGAASQQQRQGDEASAL